MNFHDHALFRETVHYWIAQIATSTGQLPQHADQHLQDANEAVESTCSALAALALPASTSCGQPWIPKSPE